LYNRSSTVDKSVERIDGGCERGGAGENKASSIIRSRLRTALFSRGIGIPRTRSRFPLPLAPLHPPAALARRPPETNSRPFFCFVPRIYPGVPPFARCVFRAAEKALGGRGGGRRSRSVRFLDVGARRRLRDETRRDETRRDETRGWNEEGDGEQATAGSYAGLRRVRGRSVPAFAGNFFPLEFSKGNDLRYISKGFLLAAVSGRDAVIHPPWATACPLPPRSSSSGPLPVQRLPDNLHFSTINLTFVQLFLPGDRPLLHLARPTYLLRVAS